MTTVSFLRLPILVVEDNPSDILFIRRAFEKAEIYSPIQVVQDGEQAVAYLQGEEPFCDRHQYLPPQLILLDLKLPRKSGLEVLEWVKSREGLKRIPVVIFTSSRETRDITKAYDMGANSYLVKPSELEVLVNMIGMVASYWLTCNERAILLEHA